MANTSSRIALITGGSSGIGFEMAKQMVAQKSVVIICGRSQTKLDEAQKKVPTLVTIQCDITSKEDRKRLYTFISDNYPNLNMLINNAGIVKRFLFSETTDLDAKIMDEWQTNYFAPMSLSKLFLPLLITNKGTLVNVTSGLVYTPLYIQPNYCATKAALHSMTQSMRIELKKHGMKVVEMLFPAVDTPFQDGRVHDIMFKPDEAARLALKGLNAGKEEIRVEKARLIYILSRLMPGKALKIITNVVPKNINEEELS